MVRGQLVLTCCASGNAPRYAPPVRISNIHHHEAITYEHHIPFYNPQTMMRQTSVTLHNTVSLQGTNAQPKEWNGFVFVIPES